MSEFGNPVQLGQSWQLAPQLVGRPEVLVTFAAKKFDEKTLELTDQPTIDIVTQELAAFDKFIRRVNGTG